MTTGRINQVSWFAHKAHLVCVCVPCARPLAGAALVTHIPLLLPHSPHTPHTLHVVVSAPRDSASRAPCAVRNGPILASGPLRPPDPHAKGPPRGFKGCL